MSRRIEIELTSKRSDGQWTWRAAGAREPKGLIEDALVPAEAKVNDVLRAEVETDLDGTRVLSIFAAKQRAEKSNVLTLLPSEKPFEGVTSQLRKKERRGPSDRKGRPRRESGGRDAKSDNADGRPRRPFFEAPPELPQRPKPKRLKAGRERIEVVLTDLPEAQRAIAERVLNGGIPAVRAAVAEQNAQAVKEGKEKVPADGIVTLAENLLPRLRVAEWHDKAEAAKAMVDELDLRDLRSVVVAAADPVVARDETTRALAEELKTALARRQEEETKNWLEDVQAATTVGRVVRALKLSSQPPKAGVRFPPELATQLSALATGSLTADAPADRWIALLEAVAFSPVRSQVTPSTPAQTVTDELKATVQRLAVLIPQISALYGITADPKSPTPRPLRPTRPEKKSPKGRSPKSDNRGPRQPNSGKPRTGKAVSEPTPTRESAVSTSNDPAPVDVAAVDVAAVEVAAANSAQED
ncbi:MAG: hypothetical protein FJW98_02310 [Actinobacteria bacterium]|nr:hypothetical protein [Actinomycetota bacterium]